MKSTLNPALTYEDLRGFQKELIALAHENPGGYAWFAGMGAGKTVTAYTYIAECMMDREWTRFLIVSTKTNAESTWPNELHKWQHLKGLTARVFSGSKRDKERALNKKADIDICSYPALLWLAEQYTADTWPYDLIIFDESSKLSDPSTKTFTAVAKVMFQNTKQMILMSGTPTGQGYHKLWSQILLIDGGQRLGNNYTEFLEEYFKLGYLGNVKGPRKGAEALIREKIKDVAVFVDPTEYLPVHERLDIFHELELPEKTMDLIATLEQDFLLLAEDIGVEDHDIEVANQGVLQFKLLQAINGFLYPNDRELHKPVKLHTMKLDKLQELFEESEQPLVVFANYQEDIDRILARIKGSKQITGSNVKQMESAFNAGKIPLLLGNPRTMAHGLNLQHGTNVGVWYGMTYSVEEYLQANERFGPVRQAQAGYNRGSIVHHLVGANTLEEEVMRRMASRIKSQSELLEFLKDRNRFPAG